MRVHTNTQALLRDSPGRQSLGKSSNMWRILSRTAMFLPLHSSGPACAQRPCANLAERDQRRQFAAKRVLCARSRIREAERGITLSCFMVVGLLTACTGKRNINLNILALGLAVWQPVLRCLPRDRSAIAASCGERQIAGLWSVGEGSGAGGTEEKAIARPTHH
jgi:hypothetical protein